MQIKDMPRSKEVVAIAILAAMALTSWKVFGLAAHPICQSLAQDSLSVAVAGALLNRQASGFSSSWASVLGDVASHALESSGQLSGLKSEAGGEMKTRQYPQECHRGTRNCPHRSTRLGPVGVASCTGLMILL